MRDSKVIQALAGVIALGSVVSMAITLRGGFSPGVERQPHQAAGWAMAKQTVSLLKPGGQVMLITRDTSEFKNPAMDVLEASFRKELRQAGKSVNTVQAVQVDPLRPLEVPPGDFLEWIRKSPAGSVIVSFMGPPMLTVAQRKQLGEIKPAIVAFCPGAMPDQINLPSLFDRAVLHAAIVSRRNSTSSASKPQGMQAWFDRNFAVVTAANVGDLAALSGNQTPVETR
jgi:hypothetical protein